MPPSEIYRPTVLVVDDDSAMLRRVTRMFHRETVLGVLQADALGKAAEFVNDRYCRFDGIVCDLSFSEPTRWPQNGLHDGFDLLKMAQSIRPNILNYILSVDADDPIAKRRADSLGLKIACWSDKLGTETSPDDATKSLWVRIEEDLIRAAAKSEHPREQVLSSKSSLLKAYNSGFDVFLAHNSADKALVEKLAVKLKEHGVKPWLDKWNLPAGRLFQSEIERVIPVTRSIAVFLGVSGVGPWENLEIRAAITQFVKRALPVIPVLLPGARAGEQFPLFLQEFGWVRFKRTTTETEPLARLIQGIKS